MTRRSFIGGLFSIPFLGIAKQAKKQKQDLPDQKVLSESEVEAIRKQGWNHVRAAFTQHVPGKMWTDGQARWIVMQDDGSIVVVPDMGLRFATSKGNGVAV